MLPVVLTGRKGAKSGKITLGQHERLTQWITGWETDQRARGHPLAIEVWDETELLGQLASADKTGGLAKYWFDEEIFNRLWFLERIDDATVQAGARYSPKLKVATPLDNALVAFGRTEVWVKTINKLSESYLEKLDRWAQTVDSAKHRPENIPAELREEASHLVARSREVGFHLSSSSQSPELLTQQSFRNAVRCSIESASIIEQKLKSVLTAKHGPWGRQPVFSPMAGRADGRLSYGIS